MQNAKFASLGKRLIAHIIDRIIMMAMFFSLFMGGLIFAGALAPVKDEFDTLSGDSFSPIEMMLGLGFLGFLCMLLLLPVFYDAVLTASSYQATFGKRIMKIKVIKDNGEKINFGDSFLRALVKYFSGTVCFLLLMICMFDKKQQNLHDYAAKTFVIEDEV